MCVYWYGTLSDSPSPSYPKADPQSVLHGSEALVTDSSTFWVDLRTAFAAALSGRVRGSDRRPDGSLYRRPYLRYGGGAAAVPPRP